MKDERWSRENRMHILEARKTLCKNMIIENLGIRKIYKKQNRLTKNAWANQ